MQPAPDAVPDAAPDDPADDPDPDSRWEVERITDAAVLLDRLRPLIDADPLGTNVTASVAVAALDGRPQPPGSFWLVAADAAGAPGGAVMCTTGFEPALTTMPDGAAAALADLLHATSHPLDAVHGDADATLAFARRWCELTGADAERVMAEGVRLLGDLVAPAGVPGTARTAVAADEPLVTEWFVDFAVEAHPGRPPGPEAARAHAALFVRRLAAGQVILWEDGGAPVSLAGWQVPSPGGLARVGPVYTPRDRRGRGYATGVTAAATRAALDAGAGGVMLHTDLANLTSNGVYARLGYALVGEASTWVFSPPRPGGGVG